MPTKSIDRLLFVQGGNCFFCSKVLDKDDASVEHLLAASRGGGNSDDNCVACCKSINALFGSMSLKEKFQVLLNQRGRFVCPNGREVARVQATPSAPAIDPAKAVSAKKTPSKAVVSSAKKPVDIAAAYLRNLKTAKPAKMATLESTIEKQLKLHKEVAADVIQQLIKAGKLRAVGAKLEYKL